MRTLLAIGVLVFAAGCEQKQPSRAQLAPKGSGEKASSYEDQVGELVGYLRFTTNEYAAAVRDGQVIDKQEFDEATLMGLKPAERAWKGLSVQVGAKDAAAAKAVTEGIAALRKLVDAKEDPAKVANAVSAISKALEGQLAGGVAPALRATIASVRAADADIKGEIVADDYRFGFVTFAPRPIGHYDDKGEWSAPQSAATHLLGIVVREKGTKRPLASAKVTADWGAGAVTLGPIWGDYLFYGANVALPEGNFTVKVAIEPPKICRHGDALASFMTEGRAEFKVTRHGAEVTVEAPRPGPVIADYRIGCDVEQAVAESIELKEEGDYRIGFIAEGPEPIWVWESGKLVSRPAKEDDTHHLEVALFERGTNRIVMAAQVSLEMKNRTTGATRTVELHNLLSEFAHYGQTLKVDSGAYEVTVRVVPPKYGLLEEGKFRGSATAVFLWEPRS
ncbi:MAG: putative periplasmic ligand-binding sensor [Planctomycetota bacterium]|nr:MAG: putative periplasmic ligand-binding sensor [Planctomycetota bacterium]